MLEGMRAHVEGSGHEIRVECPGLGKVHFLCTGCSIRWITSIDDIKTWEHPVLDQPGGMAKALNFVNAARNPTAWDRLMKSDEPV